MSSVGITIPRMVWIVAMAIVVAAAGAVVATLSSPSDSRPAEATPAADEPPDRDEPGRIDDGGAASVVETASSNAGTEPGAVGTGTTGVDRAQPETTTAGADRAWPETTAPTSVARHVDPCDTTPPLTADPSCPGQQTTTTVPPITFADDGCNSIPGRPTTTIATPHCFGTVYPTVTAAPTVTTDICDPNAVSTTHPSCVGDPHFCGAVTTIPTCPPRAPGG